MLSRFGIPDSAAATYVIAFAIILALVALFGLVLRRLTGGRLLLPGQERGRARQPRLGIVDIYDLDRQRQLILLRRDNVEHLLLIGGPNDVVIETNIVRVPGARLPTVATDTIVERAEAHERAPEVAPPRPHVEPPRPAVEAQPGSRLGMPPTRDGERAPASDRLDQPLRSEPPPAPPRPARPEQATVPRPAPPRAEPRTTAPVRSAEPVGPPELRTPDVAVLSTMTKQLEEALRRPSPPGPPPAPQGAPSAGAPPVYSAGPARPAPTPGAPPPGAGPRPVSPREAATRPMSFRPGPPAPPAQPRPSFIPSPPPPPPSAAPRPSFIPSPPPQPNQPAPNPRKDERSVPSESGTVSAEAKPTEAKPTDAKPTDAKPADAKPADAKPADAKPADAKPAEAKPVEAKPAETRSPDPKPADLPFRPIPPGPPAHGQKKVDDPFSVEEIEAEFARLLGRPMEDKGGSDRT